jgi:D-aminopeptidase
MQARLNATLLLLFCCSLLAAQRPALIVTTDLGQDPDDQQSMVRLLHYANDFDLRGLIVNADANNDYELPILADTLLHDLIAAYGEMEDNLRLHDARYPTAADLHALVKRGRAGNSRHVPATDYIGEGKDTEGSQWIVSQVRKATGPVYVSVWGGGADLAQALWSAERQLSGSDLADFVSKLRVYFIGKQDSSVDWLLDRYPKLRAVVGLDPGGDRWASTYRGMFLGGDLDLTSRRWLDEYVLNGNPLSRRYPTEAYTGGDERNPHRALKEGDSPSFLYFIPNGLNAPEHPEWGGWGGRFLPTHPYRYRDAVDTLGEEITAIASVHRWRPAFQRDFAARISWGTLDFAAANHHPTIQLNPEGTQRTPTFAASPGETVHLDASNSTDVDGDDLTFRWYAYPEAGDWPRTGKPLTDTVRGAIFHLKVPDDVPPGRTLHLILEVTDNGDIPLTAYRRIRIMTPPDQHRPRKLGIPFGVLPPGPLNAITDVAGVRVGHCTIIGGDSIRTGVTAILPHGEDMYRHKVPAAIHLGNGYGKLAGYTQVKELGELETPIVLTNTLSVPSGTRALVTACLSANPRVQSVNAVVGETNDGYLNDIRGRHVTEEDVLAALSSATTGPVAEGNVGAGTGTSCFGWKGGIGTASRKLPKNTGGYTVGVLVQTNFGGVLRIAGLPVGQALDQYYLRDAVESQADGSCMIVVATDAPLGPRNLERLAGRAMLGLARTGGIASNGSGDYVIAFSTAPENRIEMGEDRVRTVKELANYAVSPLFLAVIEATEEAIVNSLFAAEDMVGRDGHFREALPVERVLELMRD